MNSGEDILEGGSGFGVAFYSSPVKDSGIGRVIVCGNDLKTFKNNKNLAM